MGTSAHPIVPAVVRDSELLSASLHRGPASRPLGRLWLARLLSQTGCCWSINSSAHCCLRGLSLPSSPPFVVWKAGGEGGNLFSGNLWESLRISLGMSSNQPSCISLIPHVHSQIQRACGEKAERQRSAGFILGHKAIR